MSCNADANADSNDDTDAEIFNWPMLSTPRMYSTFPYMRLLHFIK